MEFGEGEKAGLWENEEGKGAPKSLQNNLVGGREGGAKVQSRDLLKKKNEKEAGKQKRKKAHTLLSWAARKETRRTQRGKNKARIGRAKRKYWLLSNWGKTQKKNQLQRRNPKPKKTQAPEARKVVKYNCAENGGR